MVTNAKSLNKIEKYGNTLSTMDDVDRALTILKERRTALAFKFLKPGKRVTFKGNGGVIEEGKIVKINRKTVSIKTKTSRWRVSLAMVRPAVN